MDTTVCIGSDITCGIISFIAEYLIFIRKILKFPPTIVDLWILSQIFVVVFQRCKGQSITADQWHQTMLTNHVAVLCAVGLVLVLVVHCSDAGMVIGIRSALQ